MFPRTLLPAALVLGALGLQHPLMAQSSDPMERYLAAAKVVSRMALIPGERVLLVGVPGEADALVPALREAVRAAAKTGREAVEHELNEGGAGARAFRELALGLNPLLEIPAEGRRWIPYYGYGAGVIRLSLGDNSELGGEVSGGYVRWNFFTDATVVVGSDTWVRNGRLVR